MSLTSVAPRRHKHELRWGRTFYREHYPVKWQPIMPFVTGDASNFTGRRYLNAKKNVSECVLGRWYQTDLNGAEAVKVPYAGNK